MERVVVFRVGEEGWAVPVDEVHGVVRCSRPTRVPNAPEEVAGLVAVRGEVLPAVRTASLLGVREPGREDLALVVESGGVRAALLVDEVVDVVEVDVDPDAERRLARLADDRCAGFVSAEELLERMREHENRGL